MGHSTSVCGTPAIEAEELQIGSSCRALGLSFTACDGPDARSLGKQLPPLAGLPAPTTRNPSELPGLPVPRRSLDLVRMGLIPVGWKKSAIPVPEGVFFAGGDACVIQRVEGCSSGGCLDAAGGKTQTLQACKHDLRVLLALPDWSVDVDRGRWIMRPLSVDWRYLSRVSQVTRRESSHIVIVEFEYPKGESLEVRLSRGTMSEEAVQNLYYDLLSLLLGTCLFFWGFFIPGTIFVFEDGRLASVLPISCLLDFEGAKAAASSAAIQKLVPELAIAFGQGDWTLPEYRDRCQFIDSYAIAATMVEALLGQERAEARHTQAVCSDEYVVASTVAHDLFQKALQDDPEWRLSARDAFHHPWLLNVCRRENSGSC